MGSGETLPAEGRTMYAKLKKYSIVVMAVVLCGAGPWVPAVAEAFTDFTPKGLDVTDLAIADVYIQENAQTVATHTKKLPFAILLDGDGAVAGVFNVTGIPVVLVVEPNGEIAFRFLDTAG